MCGWLCVWTYVCVIVDLNYKMIPDCQPIPRLQDILDGLGGNAWFSLLDQGKHITKALCLRRADTWPHSIHCGDCMNGFTSSSVLWMHQERSNGLWRNARKGWGVKFAYPTWMTYWSSQSLLMNRWKQYEECCKGWNSMESSWNRENVSFSRNKCTIWVESSQLKAAKWTLQTQSL